MIYLMTKIQNEKRFTLLVDFFFAKLKEYEDDVLCPLATERIAIDLDDGVKVNYGKFGGALSPIKGL